MHKLEVDNSRLKQELQDVKQQLVSASRSDSSAKQEEIKLVQVSHYFFSKTGETEDVNHAGRQLKIETEKNSFLEKSFKRLFSFEKVDNHNLA